MGATPSHLHFSSQILIMASGGSWKGTGQVRGHALWKGVSEMSQTLSRQAHSPCGWWRAARGPVAFPWCPAQFIPVTSFSAGISFFLIVCSALTSTTCDGSLLLCVAVLPFALIRLSEFAQHHLNQLCVWCGVLPAPAGPGPAPASRELSCRQGPLIHRCLLLVSAPFVT